MTISYVEKGAGLHAAINAAGHWLMQADGAWKSSNDTAVQSIINSYDPLPAARLIRITAIKAEGLARMQAGFPALTSVDEVAFYAEFWLSIVAGSRAPTVPFKKIIDIYTAAKNAVASVNAATTQAQIDAAAPAWPA